jgi:hypothetical protein
LAGIRHFCGLRIKRAVYPGRKTGFLIRTPHQSCVMNFARGPSKKLVGGCNSQGQSRDTGVSLRIEPARPSDRGAARLQAARVKPARIVGAPAWKATRQEIRILRLASTLFYSVH